MGSKEIRTVSVSVGLGGHHVLIYQSVGLSVIYFWFQVYFLHGIEKLLQLLNNDSEEVQRVTAGALRNVVYQSSENKMEVKDNDGLALILKTLAESHDMETRRQLTGQFVESHIFAPSIQKNIMPEVYKCLHD